MGTQRRFQIDSTVRPKMRITSVGLPTPGCRETRRQRMQKEAARSSEYENRLVWKISKIGSQGS